MKKTNIKPSTVARICALLVALANQCLAIFGKGSLPFAENSVYQIVSIALTVVVSAINCWYNQDITRLAIISGKIFDALKDGRITEDEANAIIQSAENNETVEEVQNHSFFVSLINNVMSKIRKKPQEETNEKTKQ